MKKLYGYSKVAGGDTGLVDCLGMNIAKVAALMSESAREKFLERINNHKLNFPESWKIPDEEVKVIRQGNICLVFDAGGDQTLTLFLDSGSVAPRKRGNEFQH